MLLIVALSLLLAVAQGQLVGGWTDTTVTGQEEPVQFALQAIQNKYASNGGDALTISNVIRAQTQVVAGQNMKLTLAMSNGEYCQVTVWFRSWLTGSDRLKLTQGPHCKAVVRSARAGEVSGAKHLDENTDSGVMGALSFAACSYNDQSNSMNAMMLGDLSGVTYTQQLTAGMTYTFSEVPLVESNCRNVGCARMSALLLTNPNHCQAKHHSNLSVKCTFKVQYQAWMTPQYSLFDKSC